MDKEQVWKEYSVSETVRLVGVESHVLRYWEEELGLEIQRTSQGHRIYTEQDIRMLRRVRELKEKGVQLKGIRILLRESGEDSEADSRIKEGIQRIESSYPLAVGADPSENLRQFEEILKGLIREAVREQNETLKQELAERLREELDLYFRDREAPFQEIAATGEEKEEGWIRRLRQRLRKKKESN